MALKIDDGSPLPPYEQVRAQLAGQISKGQLVPGIRLPTVRALAEELGLAPNTVARAYRELEAAGLVETRGRAGTVVSSAGDASLNYLLAAAQTYAGLARELGIPADEAGRIVRAALSG
jgi:DNA-binding transcriptional regulator YhcF (GntR family)